MKNSISVSGGGNVDQITITKGTWLISFHGSDYTYNTSVVLRDSNNNMLEYMKDNGSYPIKVENDNEVLHFENSSSSTRTYNLVQTHALRIK